MKNSFVSFARISTPTSNISFLGRKDYCSITQERNFLSAEELSMHIKGCALNDRESQKKIYSSFYGYAMTVCGRYSNNRDDAVDILQDGFLKIFKEIYRYKPLYTDGVSSFIGWLRKIMVCTAIDHFRKNHKHRFTTNLDDGVIQAGGGEDALDRISYEEIIKSVQELTPQYRAVFNLFIIEGLSHEEISDQLGISIGTSKSNLSKARRQLQKILFKKNQMQVTIRNSRKSAPAKIFPEPGVKGNKFFLIKT